MQDGSHQSAVSDAQQQLAEFSQTIFTDLQHDFHELSHEIPKESPLEPFRHEYAKLFGILQKSMTNQARYIDKCRVLESEIVGNKAKVRTVSKLSEEDARSIANLNDERDKKQAILNDNQLLLKEVMEENALISSEIDGLEVALEECVANERGQKDFLKQLKNRRSELTKEHEDLDLQVPQLQESNRLSQDRLNGREKEIESAKLELKRIEDMLEAKHRDGQTEQQRLFDLERDREATRARTKDTQQALKEKQADESQERDAVRQFEKRVREQKRRFESAKQDKHDVNDRCLKLQKDLDMIQQAIVGIEHEIGKNSKELEDLSSVEKKLQQQIQAKDADRDAVRLKTRELHERYMTLRREDDQAHTLVNAAEEDIERLRRLGEATRKEIDSTTREENGKLKRKEAIIKEKSDGQRLLVAYRNQAHNIECEISIIKLHLQETQKKIFGIENETERYSEELSAAMSQQKHAEQVLDEIQRKVREKSVEIGVVDEKVREQQKLYEKVRGEREAAAKKVKEVEAEIKTLENMFSRMKFAIEQHKDDIKRKEREYALDKDRFEKINRDDGRLREQLTEVQLEDREAKKAITGYQGDLSKLEKAITAAEANLRSHEIDLEKVRKQRDQLSTDTRETEQKLLRMDERLKARQNECERGAKDYDARDMEISRLEAQVQHDQEKLDELSQIDGMIKNRREQIHNKQKQLMQLRAERAAMEEELSIPINIHRWTLLESSDPKRFGELKRYQELQTALVAKTKQVADLQELIKRKEARYMELAAQVRRRPGFEVEQRANEYKTTCKAEKFNLEQITSKLEMYRGMVKEYQKELGDVQKDLIDERVKWIKQKKRELKRRQEMDEQQATLEALGVNIKL